MRKWVICCVIVVILIGTGCQVVKDVLKIVAISQKINAVQEAEGLYKLRALKDLIEEMRE